MAIIGTRRCIASSGWLVGRTRPAPPVLRSGIAVVVPPITCVCRWILQADPCTVQSMQSTCKVGYGQWARIRHLHLEDLQLSSPARVWCRPGRGTRRSGEHGLEVACTVCRNSTVILGTLRKYCALGLSVRWSLLAIPSVLPGLPLPTGTYPRLHAWCFRMSETAYDAAPARARTLQRQLPSCPMYQVCPYSRKPRRT